MPADPREAVDAALAIVREAELDADSPSGVAVLSALLNHLLAAPATTAPPPGDPADVSAARGDSPVAKVAAWARVDIDQILDFVHFAEEGDARPTIPAARLPSTKAKQQRVLAVLKLALDRVAYGQEDASTRTIYRFLDDYGIADQNVVQNLIGRGNLVTRRGQRASASYRLTVQGVETAKAVLVELVRGGSIVEV